MIFRIKKHAILGACIALLGIITAFACIEYGRRFLNFKGCTISVAECYMTVGTFISAVATACMAWIAYDGNKQGKENSKIAKASAEAAQKQAEAAIQSLQEAQKQWEEAYRPRLVVYFERKHAYKLQLIIKNFGNMPARDISINILASFLCSPGRTIPYLRCEQDICICGNLLPLSPVQLFLIQTEGFRIRIKYKTPYENDEKCFDETFPLYLSSIIPEKTNEVIVAAFEQCDGKKFNDICEYIECFIALCLPAHKPTLDRSTATIFNFMQDFALVSSFLGKVSETERGKISSAEENYLQPVADAYREAVKNLSEAINKECKGIFGDQLSRAEQLQTGIICHQVAALKSLFDQISIYRRTYALPIVDNGNRCSEHELNILFFGIDTQIVEKILNKIDEIEKDTCIKQCSKPVRMLEAICLEPSFKKLFEEICEDKKISGDKKLLLVPDATAEAAKKLCSTCDAYKKHYLELESNSSKLAQSCAGGAKHCHHICICANSIAQRLKILWQHPLWIYKDLLLMQNAEKVRALLKHVRSDSIHENKRPCLKKALYELANLICEKNGKDAVTDPSSYCNWSKSKRYPTFFESACGILKTFFDEHKELDKKPDLLAKFLTEP